VLTKDRVEDAFAAFKYTYAEKTTDLDIEVEEQFNLMHAQLLYEKQNAVSYKGLFTKASYRKRVFLGWIMLFGLQCTGTQVINSTFEVLIHQALAKIGIFKDYGPLIYGSLGFGTAQQLLMGAGWISMAPFGNIITSLLVDKVGRVKMFRV
jgi:hypothetical protein